MPWPAKEMVNCLLPEPLTGATPVTVMAPAGPVKLTSLASNVAKLMLLLKVTCTLLRGAKSVASFAGLLAMICGP